MSPKIAIVFTDPHLAYSPTTLNLKAEIKRRFPVHIISFKNKTYFGLVKDPDIIYLDHSEQIRGLRLIWLRIFKKFSPSGLSLPEIMKKVSLRKVLRANQYTRVIAVDFEALWYLDGIYGGKIDLLSLELDGGETRFSKEIANVGVDNLIIQDTSRLGRLRFEKYERVIIIQNSPPFYRSIEQASPNKRFTHNFVFSGTAVPQFGLFSCVRYLRHNSELTLTLMGAISFEVTEALIMIAPDLFHENRLMIRNQYLEEYEYCQELSSYSVGFCFYEFHHPVIKSRYDNYRHGPAGKMFKYFAAGVPVIGLDIPGLSPIRDFEAGVLIDRISNHAIDSAIAMIMNNYSFYVKNCFTAAKHFDFSGMCEPYLALISKDK